MARFTDWAWANRLIGTRTDDFKKRVDEINQLDKRGTKMALIIETIAFVTAILVSTAFCKLPLVWYERVALSMGIFVAASLLSTIVRAVFIIRSMLNYEHLLVEEILLNQLDEMDAKSARPVRQEVNVVTVDDHNMMSAKKIWVDVE